MSKIERLINAVNFAEEPENEQEEGREWEGKFVGYPLVEITDREAAKEKILDKLFR